MLNHSSEPARRATSLLKLDLPMDVEVEGVGRVAFKGFFSMKAGEGAAGVGLGLLLCLRVRGVGARSRGWGRGGPVWAVVQCCGVLCLLG